MVVIAISAILMALAAPSMRNLIESNGIAESVHSLMGAVSYARAEAMKRGLTVTVCRSIDADTARPPACITGTDWASGWIVFADLDDNGKFQAKAGDVLLRTQGSLAGSGSIERNATDSLRFAATGLMRGGQPSGFVFLPPSRTPSARRTACLARIGRMRVVTDPAKEGC